MPHVRRLLSGLIDVFAFNILPAWLAWIRQRTCGRSVYFRLALRVQKEASAVAVFVFVLCATWCEEASSVVCEWTVLCAAAACTALAVPPPGACSDAGCAKRRLAQLIAVPPFLHVYCVPAAGPAARAELIVDAQAAALRGCGRLLGVRCCCALGPRSQPAGVDLLHEQLWQHLMPHPGGGGGADGSGRRAARRGVWCERLVRSSRCCVGWGGKQHAGMQHRAQACTRGGGAITPPLSPSLQRPPQGCTASLFLHSISCSTVGAAKLVQGPSCRCRRHHVTSLCRQPRRYHHRSR